jgi:hypothetical protein
MHRKVQSRPALEKAMYHLVLDHNKRRKRISIRKNHSLGLPWQLTCTYLKTLLKWEHFHLAVCNIQTIMPYADNIMPLTMTTMEPSSAASLLNKYTNSNQTSLIYK